MSIPTQPEQNVDLPLACQAENAPASLGQGFSSESPSKIAQPAEAVLSGADLDAAIAERVMGWHIEAHTALSGDRAILQDRWVDPSGERGPWKTLWRPSADLNATYQAQFKCIEKMGAGAYTEALIKELGWTLLTARQWDDDHSDATGNIREGSWNTNFEAYRRIAIATAEQRCRAMLGATEASTPEGTGYLATAEPTSPTPIQKKSALSVEAEEQP